MVPRQTPSAEIPPSAVTVKPMAGQGTEDPNWEPKAIEIGPDNVIGSGEDSELGLSWTLVIRDFVTEEETIPGLFLETDEGGGGSARSRGLDPSPDLIKVNMRALTGGLVALFGPVARHPIVKSVTVEFPDGTTKLAHLLPGGVPWPVDFFVAIIDRRPSRVAVSSERSGQWISVDRPDFHYRNGGLSS